MKEWKRYNYGFRLVVVFSFIFFIFNCKPSSHAKSQEEYEQKISKLHEYYKSQIKETYEISNSARNVEEAIMNFLNEVAQGNGEYKTLCDEREIKEIFLPNNYNTGTIISFQEPEEAWKTISIRRQFGLEELERKLKGKKLVLSKIKIKSEVRNLNSLKGHVPSQIVVNVNSEELSIEQIKLIIEHKGQFKVCVVSQ
ncbi:MAG: hypothetical protein N3A69_02855 [Leptospiraceae bacterium]|nr:hypothetical protein [Leptospiraceae bacterium]